MALLDFGKKKEFISNALVDFNFPAGYFVKSADGRMGQKFAIASNLENGGIEVHTNYMGYEEFNCYLFGLRDGLNNKFKNKLGR